MNYKSKISIIVPVYNVEKYLSRCIESLINQIYQNIEIICINDGSTDNSLQILENYTNKDNRIKVINQQNQGVSVARNIGLDNATGDYILFVDADDWLEISACETLTKQIEADLDIIFFAYKRNEKTIVKNYNFQGLNLDYAKKYYWSEIYNKTSITNAPKGIWNKLYRIQYIKKYNLRFPSRVSHCEDAIFLMEVLMFNPLVKILNETLYNYDCTRENSATKISRLAYLHKNIIYRDAILAFDINNDFQKYIKSCFLDDYFNNLVLLAHNLYYNKEYQEILSISVKKLKNDILQNLSGYRKAKYCDVLIKSRLSYFYWGILRPICKHCVVLPYRRIKQILRGKNV